jgi:hypothetical protein
MARMGAGRARSGPSTQLQPPRLEARLALPIKPATCLLPETSATVKQDFSKQSSQPWPCIPWKRRGVLSPAPLWPAQAGATTANTHPVQAAAINPQSFPHHHSQACFCCPAPQG